MVALLIAMVKVPIQPPNPLITSSRNLKGHQDFPVSLSRVPKEPLAPLNLPNILVVISKIAAKTPLKPPNLPYTPEIPSKIPIKKLLVPPNISELPVAPSSVSKPLIDLSRVPMMLLVPLIYPNINTKGDSRPQHPTPQVRRKYKISLENEAVIDFLSPTATSVTYSRLSGSSLGSSFGLLSKNTDNPLATNLDSPLISRLIESIVAKKKNAKEEARLAAVAKKKAATVAKKTTVAKRRKV